MRGFGNTCRIGDVRCRMSLEERSSMEVPVYTAGEVPDSTFLPGFDNIEMVFV